MTEEQKDVLKEYTRNMQRRHNRENAAHSRRTRLMKKAVGALPENLRRQAEEIDEALFPSYPLPTDTPPKPDHVHPEHYL